MLKEVMGRGGPSGRGGHVAAADVATDALLRQDSR